jgi:hypothetical protein
VEDFQIRFLLKTVIVLLCSLLISCGILKNPEPPQHPKEIRIRVHNKSRADFDSVTISFPDTYVGPGYRVEFGAIPKGKKSEYMTVSFACAVGHVEATADGRQYQNSIACGNAFTQRIGLGLYTYGLALEDNALQFVSWKVVE